MVKVSVAQNACACDAKPDLRPVGRSAAFATARYRIANMDCPTEEALIRQRLSAVPGVEALDFNLIERMLGVHHTLPDLAVIESALKSIGMRAQRVDISVASDDERSVYRIENMDCPTEETLIRRRLSSVAGLRDLEFNLMQRTLTVTHGRDDREQLESALGSIGMKAKRQNAASQQAPVPEAGAPSLRARVLATASTQRFQYALLTVSGVCAVGAEAVSWLTGDNHWSIMALALVAILTGGLTTYKKGWIAIRNRNLNINALMSIAVTGALLIGHWPEAAMVMFLFTVAELIEAKSLNRARNAIRGLLSLAPEMATVRRDDGSWHEVQAKIVALNAQVRVKPGERVALDGQVVSGRSTINQAPITGESLPVEKAPGDRVYAGTINESGSFEYRVTARATDSTLARIIHAVEAAQASRAPTQRFVDQFSRIYTPAVLVLAVTIAVVPPLLFAADWMTWIYRALVMLVVACPCALVISTPVTIVSGLAAAARRGILIKGGAFLEGGRKLQVLALDKTGTITHGRPEQTDVLVRGAEEGRIRAVAASLAARSDHPVSQAILRTAQRDAIELYEVDDFSALPGYGVRGRVDGIEYHLCNRRWVNDNLGALDAAFNLQLDALERQGKTLVLLVQMNEVLAAFAVADTVKESSRQAIAELHGLGVRTLMLSGDNPHTAEAIADQVGIDEARGHQLPEDKLAVIEAEHRAEHVVGMVGDGINDAPALARADIGFAMGAAGTDTAIETADVALMDDDLRKIPRFIELSRSTALLLTQNIAFALSVKAVFLVLTFTGHATMWMAVFADMGASLIVVANGLRLLRR